MTTSEATELCDLIERFRLLMKLSLDIEHHGFDNKHHRVVTALACMHIGGVLDRRLMESAWKLVLDWLDSEASGRNSTEELDGFLLYGFDIRVKVKACLEDLITPDACGSMMTGCTMEDMLEHIHTILEYL